ncbi:hypothetical protein QR685DRAFT_572337 [Neurospora intermedia]|uniref:Uncharacterized protein n=1 Tax=Neurospora intermedia TaxID=5142 RepID=A0ABR3D9G0_NEUIN
MSSTNSSPAPATHYVELRYQRLGYRTIGDIDDDVGSVVAAGSPPGSDGGSPMQISAQSSPARVAASPDRGGGSWRRNVDAKLEAMDGKLDELLVLAKEDREE